MSKSKPLIKKAFKLNEGLFFTKIYLFSGISLALNWLSPIALPYMLFIFAIPNIIELINAITIARLTGKPNREEIFFSAMRLTLNVLGPLIYLLTSIISFLYLPVIISAGESLRSLIYMIKELFDAHKSTDPAIKKALQKNAFLNCAKFIYFGCLAAGIVMSYILTGFTLPAAIAFATPLVLALIQIFTSTSWESLKFWKQKPEDFDSPAEMPVDISSPTIDHGAEVSPTTVLQPAASPKPQSPLAVNFEKPPRVPRPSTATANP